MPKPVKYREFREVVKDLIGIEVSESETKVVESKLIEYAVNRNYYIYVTVACLDWSQEFRLTKEDLLRFKRTSRAEVNIEKLRLYTQAEYAFGEYCHECFEPDENGNFPEYPKVSKTDSITTDEFLVDDEDIPLLKEAIESGDLDLNVKLDKGKTKKRRQRIPDNVFKQLCKEVEREYCTREAGERIFFGKLSEVSKLPEYDTTGRGYKTWQSAKKRYYEVFPSKKANH